jgi:uncharacterized protein (DUF3820 family)
MSDTFDHCYEAYSQLDDDGVDGFERDSDAKLKGKIYPECKYCNSTDVYWKEGRLYNWDDNCLHLCQSYYDAKGIPIVIDKEDTAVWIVQGVKDKIPFGRYKGKMYEDIHEDYKSSLYKKGLLKHGERFKEELYKWYLEEVYS